MIVSRAKKFIFIRTRKVASTSVEFALSKLCTEEDDIITPLGMPDEYLRYQLGVVPRNYARSSQLEKVYADVLAGGDAAKISSLAQAMEPDNLFWGHMSANEIRERVGASFWDSAFKFSVVRHPYEFVLSQLYFDMRRFGISQNSMGEYLFLARTILRMPLNYDLISIDGALVVDKVLHHESLKQDLQAIAPRLGRDISEDLPLAKAGIRPKLATVDAKLGLFARWLIRRRWNKEFKAFSYPP